jgi:glycosyltransferase involved in cell wall biosynthesis
MKIIYYSTAYYATHGGSNHSKAFVDAARKNKEVSEVIVFPAPEKIRKAVSITSSGSTTISSIIKKSGFASVFRFIRRSRFYLEEIFDLIRKENPTAIVIRLDSNFPQISKIKDRFPGVIVATEVNASPFEEGFKDVSFRKMFQKLERKHLSRADLNFFVSGTLMNSIMTSRYSKERDFVLPNGVDVNLFLPAVDKVESKAVLGLPIDKKIIGYIGTLDITKKLGILLQAFDLLSKIRQDVFFVIIGDGPDFETARKKGMEFNLMDRLLLTGKIPHHDVPKYLQAFDIAVHHAANDYMCPLKLFEYFAARVPVVGPDTPAVREVFEDKKHLHLCKDNAESVLEKILLYLNDAKQADDMAQSGMELVRSKYTWQKNADMVINKLESRKS